MPLSVRPVNAALTHDTDMLTLMKMDPYVVITLGAERQRTQICRNGGKNPFWNETLYFNNMNNDQVMQIEVWDKDYLTKDDIVGAGQLNIASFADGMRRQQTVTLYYKGRSAGQIVLEGCFNGTNGQFGAMNQINMMNQMNMMGNGGMSMMPQMGQMGQMGQMNPFPQMPMSNPLYGSNATNNGLYGSNAGMPINSGGALYTSNVVPVNIGGPNPFVRPVSPMAPMAPMNVRPISPMGVRPLSPMPMRPISPMQNISMVNMMPNRPISPMMNQMPIQVGPMNGMSNQWYPPYNRY